MYWKKLLGITTLSCRVRSIKLRPEWPWRARRYTIVPEESVQYWIFFLCPPAPAVLFFHLLSDQWKQYKKYSEEFLSLSRIELLHHLIDAHVNHDEKDESISSIFFQIHHILVGSMRNSDPRVSIISVHRRNSDLNSVFTMQTTSCNFQYGPNFGVPLDPSFWLWCFFLSWKSVCTTVHCMKLLEFRSVFRHEVLSNLNNIHLSNGSPYCCNGRSLLAKWSQSKGTSVLITLGTSEELDCRVAPIDREGFRSLHTFLWLLRKDWTVLQKQLCERVSIFFKSAE